MRLRSCYRLEKALSNRIASVGRPRRLPRVPSRSGPASVARPPDTRPRRDPGGSGRAGPTGLQAGLDDLGGPVRCDSGMGNPPRGGRDRRSPRGPAPPRPTRRPRRGPVAWDPPARRLIGSEDPHTGRKIFRPRFRSTAGWDSTDGGLSRGDHPPGFFAGPAGPDPPRAARSRPIRPFRNCSGRRCNTRVGKWSSSLGGSH